MVREGALTKTIVGEIRLESSQDFSEDAGVNEQGAKYATLFGARNDTDSTPLPSITKPMKTIERTFSIKSSHLTIFLL